MIAFENILSGIQSTGVFIIFLSILIIVHEWGHFITAKKLGVGVEEFALGFGPTLFSKHYNGTDYLVKAFPLGGYVKMVGDERDKCTGQPEEFYSKSPGHRSLIVKNGPDVNFILAYICFIFVFMIGYPGFSTKITEVITGGPAQSAGLLVNDRVVAIGSKEVYGWLHLERELEGSGNDPINVTVLRGGQEMTVAIIPKIVRRPNLIGQEKDYRDIGIGFQENVIGGIVKGFPAEAVGLKVGDQVVEIDSKEIRNWTALQKAIADSKNDQIELKILRDGEIFTQMITPQIETFADEDGQDKQVRKIGIGPRHEFELFKFDTLTSLQYAYEELGYITVLTYQSLWRMVTGAMSARQSVTGPVGIFYIVKGAADEGLSHILFILGVISASLAIFNLLPLIPLDGGHLFLLGIEKVRGKALPPKIDEGIARLGFSLIILLALFVFYSDFVRFGWIDKLMEIFS